MKNFRHICNKRLILLNFVVFVSLYIIYLFCLCFPDVLFGDGGQLLCVEQLPSLFYLLVQRGSVHLLRHHLQELIKVNLPIA